MASNKIASYYDIKLNVLEFSGLSSSQKCARNAFLLISTLMEFSESSAIALGIHAGTDYKDYSPLFIQKKQPIFDIYSGGKVQVSAPFLSWSKAEIWNYCKIKTHILN